MIQIKLAFYSIVGKTGCTTAVLQSAQYLAEKDYEVVIVDREGVRNPQSSGRKHKITEEEILIYDLGLVTDGHDMTGYDGLYLCSGNGEEDLDYVNEYSKEANFHSTVLIMECSKSRLQEFRQIVGESYSIPLTPNNCPMELAKLMDAMIEKNRVKLHSEGNKEDEKRQEETRQEEIAKEEAAQEGTIILGESKVNHAEQQMYDRTEARQKLSDLGPGENQEVQQIFNEPKEATIPERASGGGKDEDKKLTYTERENPFGDDGNSANGEGNNEEELEQDETILEVAKQLKDKFFNSAIGSYLLQNVKALKPLGSEVKFYGHMSIFVTGLRHGCGCTYTAGSLASTMVSVLGETICICHKSGTNYPRNQRIREYTGVSNYEQAYQDKIVVYDCGILGELTQVEMVEMMRADVRIMVCNGEESDIQRLARFIHKTGNNASKWLYVFELVPSIRKELKIRELMQEYAILFLPLHDYTNVPPKLKREWIKRIKAVRE